MKTTEQLIAEVTAELSAAFTSIETANKDTRLIIKEDAPEWITAKDSNHQYLIMRVHEALDDRLPGDWVYESTESIANALNEYDNIEAMRDASGEIADRLVDVYTSELTKWLASHNLNIGLCDDAANELGRADGIEAAIQQGQYYALELITNALIHEIEAEVEKRMEAQESEVE